MNETAQLDFLLELGRRLDRWSRPGDAEDYLPQDGGPLWDRAARQLLAVPARVGDLLLFRWFRIKDFSTQRPVAFVLNPAQRDFSRRRTGRDIIVKAGRGGFTTYLAMRGLLRTITRQGQTGLLVAHKKEAAKAYLLDVHFAFDHLPGKLGQLLRTGALRTTGPGAQKNVNSIYFPALNSRFSIETAGEFAPAEGESLQYLLCDEMARWRKGDPAQVVATLLSHVTGDDTEVAMFSRPFGDAGEFAERYHAAKRGESDFRAHFYAWYWNPAQQVRHASNLKLTEEEEQLRRRYADWRRADAPRDCGLALELHPTQLAWRRRQCRELGDKFPQEFAEDDISCFRGSGNCPFDSVALDKIIADHTSILERLAGAGEAENGLWIWRMPERGRRYILFADVASTLYLSRAAFEVLDLETGEQVAEYAGRIDPYAYGRLIEETGRRFNDAVVAVESNLGDISVTVLRALDRYPNLYWHRAAGEQAHLGWRTDAHTRPMMLDRLAATVREHPELFHSKRLAAELKTCERTGDRIQARKGRTDDLMMAAAGALSVRATGASAEPPHVHVIDLDGRDSDRGWRKLG